MRVSEEFTVELSSGRKVTAEMTCDISKEINHGADIGGAGGTTAYWTDNIRLATPLKKEPLLDVTGLRLGVEETEEALDRLSEACLDHPWEF